MLLFEGCPSAPAALEVLQEVLRKEGITGPVKIVQVSDADAAKRERFLGSPSIQIDGLDIEEARRADLPCLGCRLYPNGGGIPPEAMIREAIQRALAQKLKILFLCTGNACRSQMAEGWARHLKSDVLHAYSAGVEPHGLDPRAVKVMAEAGVDISNQRSKHVKELMDVPFDFVVTVCDNANEQCPFFPGKVKVVHVGFDDPPKLAANAKTEEEALAHYRRVRDEIRAFVQKLPTLFTDRKE